MLPFQSNPSPKEQNYYVHLFFQVLSKVTVMMHGNLFYATVKMVALILKVLILINHTVQWNIMTNSESTFIS